MNFYKEEVKGINVITMSKKFNLNNSYMVFEGITSAIREYSRKSKFSLIYLPKKIFILSNNNFIKHDLHFKKNKIKIVQDDKDLFKNLQLKI